MAGFTTPGIWPPVVDREALVAFAQALVRIPSVHDPARGLNEAPVARLVTDRLTGWGWSPVVEEVAPGRPNVICVVEGGLPGPTLLLEGHSDVVTEGDPAGWTVDPFGAEIVDGRLYGRGSADMKAGVAAMLWAAHALASAGPFPGRLKLAVLVDEEGLMLGAKHFVASGHAAGVDGAICCEPEAGEVCHVAKGALRLHARWTGAMAHGAMPHHGRNPLPAVARLVTRLHDEESRLQAAHPTDPFLGDVYLTPTVLRAGEPVQMNVMPATAELWVDVRTVPGVDHGEVVARVTALAAEAGAPDGVIAALDVIDDRPAVHTPADHPVVQAVLAAHEAVTGEPGRLGGVPGATDGTVITSRAGVPSVVYGPGGKWIAHQADEFVEVADLLQAADVYVEAACRFLAGGTGRSSGGATSDH
jgi:succinyl-diaminopimelate desuccinylase